MKSIALICVAALAACSRQPDSSCPALEKAISGNPVNDARSAIAKGDKRLLMLGGFVGTVPGAEKADAYQTRMLDGTSDVELESCRRLRASAEAYAAKYNTTVLGRPTS